jgi:hypothetical protein
MTKNIFSGDIDKLTLGISAVKKDIVNILIKNPIYRSHYEI